MFLSLQEAIVHTTTVTLSIVVLGISVAAYRRRGGNRYAALTIAFLFLALSEVVQFVESASLNASIFVPVLEIHLSHLLDLAMLVSFGFALVTKG
ncbi:MAG: hypothetical protein OK438_01205 [Thaumarchaeota archaeon]|nr:hypothetical protein [Nitrososphaerota archaeon]